MVGHFWSELLVSAVGLVQANCGGAKEMDHFPRLYPESLRAD